MHATTGEYGHIETLVQPPSDLNAEQKQDNEHIEVMLADCSALVLKQAPSQGIYYRTENGNGNIGMENAP